jgi:hypothetical protein
MIKLLRELLYNFLLANKSLKINELSLEQAIQAIQAITGVSESFETYCTNIVRTMGEEARDILTTILPSILRIKICTVVLDTKASTSVASCLIIVERSLY